MNYRERKKERMETERMERMKREKMEKDHELQFSYGRVELNHGEHN